MKVGIPWSNFFPLFRLPFYFFHGEKNVDIGKLIPGKCWGLKENCGIWGLKKQ
jgi:hypothetical protein